VGENPDVEEYQIEGNWWIRIIFYIVIGLIVAGIGYRVYRYIRSRR
jgi:hypothetical protein